MEFRTLALGADWEPDREYLLKGTKVSYTTIGKLKRSLSPLLVKAGLDLRFELVDVEDIDFTIRLTVRFILTDALTGETESTEVVADGSKATPAYAIPTAMSYAMRIYLLNRFQLADGIEPEEVQADPIPPARTVTVPQKPVQAPDVVRIPVKDAAKTPRPVSVLTAQQIVQGQKDAQQPSCPFHQPPKTAGTPTAPQVPPVPQTPAVQKDGEGSPQTISPMEKAAAVKAMPVIEGAFRQGKLAKESYEAARKVMDSVEAGTGTAKDVYLLINLRREIEEKNPAAKEGM